MGWLEVNGLFGAGVALTAGAGVLFLISYWWSSDRKRDNRHDTGESTRLLRNGECGKYETGRHVHDDINKENNYLQIVEELNTKLDDERVRSEQAETRCRKFQTELDSLTQEHTALQDSHEKLLKQYNYVSLKLKLVEERHKKLRDALECADIPEELSNCLCFDEDDIDIEHLRNEPEDSSAEVLEDASDQSEDDLESDENSEHCPLDFELTENVMHALISRDSVTELLVGGMTADPDDLSDLVGQNLADAEGDLDELVSNNSQYSQEEEEEEAEKLRLQVENLSDDVNAEHISDVKSARQMWETRIREQDSPSSSRGRLSSASGSSSNRSSPSGLHNPGRDDVTSRLKEIRSRTDEIAKQRNNNSVNISGDVIGIEENKFNELRKQWETVAQSNSEEDD